MDGQVSAAPLALGSSSNGPPNTTWRATSTAPTARLSVVTRRAYFWRQHQQLVAGMSAVLRALDSLDRAASSVPQQLQLGILEYPLLPAGFAFGWKGIAISIFLWPLYGWWCVRQGYEGSPFDALFYYSCVAYAGQSVSRVLKRVVARRRPEFAKQPPRLVTVLRRAPRGRRGRWLIPSRARAWAGSGTARSSPTRPTATVFRRGTA